MLQHPKLKKRIYIMSITLIIVLGGIMAFNGIKSIMIKRFFAHYQLPAVTVASAQVMEKTWKPKLSSVGNFVAINGVDVNAQVSGSVVAIHFDSGQYIEKEHPLIDIDDQVDQATFKYDQADLALQEVNFQRQKDLLSHHATSGSSVDEAKAKLLEAQANLEKTQAQIRQKHITAPFSGQLGIRQINLGQYIFPGQTAIVTLQSLDPIFLEFYLPEQALDHLHQNQAITFSVEQTPNVLFQGKITAINSKIDTNTHTIQVQATLANCPLEALNDPWHSPMVRVKKQALSGKTVVVCDSKLNAENHIAHYNFVPGMFASIEISEPAIQKVLMVPTTAISYTLYDNSVFTINHETDKLLVKRVFVTTGSTQGNYTRIKKGLKAGQMVVASGELKLQDGTLVTINNDVQLPNLPSKDLGP